MPAITSAKPIKIYTHVQSSNGFVSPAVQRALGLPSHVGQATVLVAARTKAEAVRLAEAAGALHVRSPRDLREAMGLVSRAVLEARVLNEPGVLFTYLTPHPGAPLVSYRPAAGYVRLGRLGGGEVPGQGYVVVLSDEGLDSLAAPLKVVPGSPYESAEVRVGPLESPRHEGRLAVEVELRGAGSLSTVVTLADPAVVEELARKLKDAAANLRSDALYRRASQR